MDTIIIENIGGQAITCEDVSQNGQLMNQSVLIKPHEKKELYHGSTGNSVLIKVGAGDAQNWNENKERDRSTMPKPKLVK
jgi:hypothetical protein